MTLPEYLENLRTQLPAEERAGAADAVASPCEREHDAFLAGVERTLDALAHWATTVGVVAELPLPAEECLEGEDGDPSVWWEKSDDLAMDVSLRPTRLRLNGGEASTRFLVHDGNRIMDPALAWEQARELMAAARIAELGGLDEFLNSLSGK